MGKYLVDLPRSMPELDSLGKEYLKQLIPQSDIIKETALNLEFIQTVVDQSIQEAKGEINFIKADANPEKSPKI